MIAVAGQRRGAGRPEVTSHAAIEAAAFRLFAARGFEQTTLDAIADEVGVSRRTLFRYYASKNDIPWGQFDRTLDAFREILASLPDDLPLWEAVHRGVVAFNDFPPDAQPPHRDRMRLILTTPALQAHSVLRYSEWRQVIAEPLLEAALVDRVVDAAPDKHGADRCGEGSKAGRDQRMDSECHCQAEGDGDDGDRVA